MKCYEYHKMKNKKCKNKKCRYWIDVSELNSCTIVGASSKHNITLEDIGKIFKVTRMRICQIEKKAIEKIKNIILDQ